MNTGAPGRANPYVGPRPLLTGEELYGRDREIFQLFNLVIAQRIVLFYSPSGAGKTSLIQAGLIPRLEEEGFSVLPIIRVNQELEDLSGSAPARNRYLTSTLLSLEQEVAPDRQQASSRLVTLGLEEYLGLREGSEKGTEIILIFDQFEELLTVDPADREAKKEFFTELGSALRRHHRWALFSMREDLIAGLDPYLSLLPTRLATTFRLDLLTEEAARLAITRPAQRAGVAFTEPAARMLVDDLGRLEGEQAGEPVLGPHVEPLHLQVVCRRLWDRLPPEAREITEADIASGGDVDAALADYYSERVAAAAVESGVGERDIRDWFEDRLITDQRFRSQVQEGPTGGVSGRAALRLLVDAHLIRSEPRRGNTWLELAHDRLVRPVRESNAAWREKNLTHLQREAALWADAGRPDGLLLTGEILDEAERWAEDHDDLKPAEKHFLDASRRARADLERQQRQARQTRRLKIAIVSLLGGIAIFAAYFAFHTRGKLQISRASEIISEAEKNLDRDPNLSIWLAREAVKGTLKTPDRFVAREARTTLYRAVSNTSPRLTLPEPDAYKIAFSPDGERVATAGPGDKVAIWDAMSGKEEKLKNCRLGAGRVSDIAFSQDGRRLAAAGGTGFRVWDVRSGKPLPGDDLAPDRRAPSPGPDYKKVGANAVALSPDGKLLAVGGGEVSLWNVSGSKPQRLPDLDLSALADVGDVAFSPDGKSIAVAAEDKVFIQRIEPFKRVASLPPDAGKQGGRKARIVGIAYSPDGSRLAVLSADGVTIREAASGKELRRLVDPDDRGVGVSEVAFSPDGRHVATGAGVWVAASGRKVLSLPMERDFETPPERGARIDSVAFSPDGRRLATAGGEAAPAIRELDLPPPSGHTGLVAGVAFSPDGSRLATGSRDGTAGVWDASSGRELLTFSGHTSSVLDVSFSPDGSRLATAGYDGTARVWDASSGKELLKLSGHTGQVLDVSFSPDGSRLATAGGDGTARVWDASSGKELLTFSGHTGPVAGVAFSPDGSRLATAGGDGTARVWDASSDRELLTFSGHTSLVYDVSFSPDGSRLATAGYDGTARVWDASSGKELVATPSGRFSGDDPVDALAFSPDGKRVATARDRTVAIWDRACLDRASRKPPRHFEQDSPVRDVTFIANGRQLAIASATELIIRDAGSGEQRRAQPYPWADHAVFSPDGRYLATAGDRDVKVRDVSGIKEIASIHHDRPVRDMRFSPGGEYLVTTVGQEGGSGEEVEVWSAASGKPLAGPRPAEQARPVAFSRNGKLLATADRKGRVTVRDLRGSKKRLPFPPLTGEVAGLAFRWVAFGPGDTRLATINDNDALQIWEADSSGWKERVRIPGVSGEWDFSPDWRYVAVAREGSSGFVVYPLDPDELIEVAARRARRSLTTDECRKYLPDRECPSKREGG